MKTSTTAIHAGNPSDKWSSMALITPISPSTTFELLEPGKPKQYEYSRYDNPSRNILETRLASLDGGKFALAFSSGIGTLNAVVQLLNAADHVICSDAIYGGTHHYFCEIACKFGIEVSFVDLTDLKNIDQEIKSSTKLILLENPSNTLMSVFDIKTIAEFVKLKSPNVIVVADNTFMTSYFQKPLTLGADISLYSLTKYMNGHSDVVMGAAVTNNETIYKNLKRIQMCLKTLSIRMQKHMKNALKVAQFLESHPMVLRVLYPGLKSHPGHEMAKKQWSGCSGMLSFYIKGDIEDAKLLIIKLKYFTCAASLGGCESLIGVPALMSHSCVPRVEREKLGLSDNLIRLSVGLESANDLVQDLDQALGAVQETKKRDVN